MLKTKVNVARLSDMYYKQGKTLQDIGNIFGVSKERVRQIMQHNGLKRIRQRAHTKRRPIQTIEDFLSAGKDNSNGKKNSCYMSQISSPIKKKCIECNIPFSKLHIHHLRYPAKSIKDIIILCRVCHSGIHRKGMTVKKQIEVCKLYLSDESITALIIAKKYNVSKNDIYHILHDWHVSMKKRGRRI